MKTPFSEDPYAKEKRVAAIFGGFLLLLLLITLKMFLSTS
jgi:hypothetical protein